MHWRRCLRTLVNSSMIVGAAVCGSSRRPATAACSAHTVRSRVHPFRMASPAADPRYQPYEGSDMRLMVPGSSAEISKRMARRERRATFSPGAVRAAASRRCLTAPRSCAVIDITGRRPAAPRIDCSVLGREASLVAHAPTLPERAAIPAAELSGSASSLFVPSCA